MSDDYPIPTDAEGYLRREAKRGMQQARRPSFKGIKQELGPGIAPRAVQILDWNSEECTFNGYFYSVQGVLSSPDPAVRWFGEVWAQDDFNGVQTIREAEPPEVEAPDPPPPDPAAIPPTEENPEPEPPSEGNPTPIRAYTRYFSVSEEGYADYTDWEPVGAGSGGALRDLSDVHIFDPLTHHDVLLWNSDFNEGEGAWNNYPFIPGINDLQNNIDDILQDMEDIIDFQGSTIRVFRQPEVPVPGEEGAPDPIPDGSIWFDTDDDMRMRVWDPSSSSDPELLHWVDIDSALTAEQAAALAQAQADATEALDQASEAINQLTGVTPITGALIQTSELANRGIKLYDGGLIGYNASGTPTFNLNPSTGALTMLGTIQSGSSIAGATLTGILQTSAASNTGVKISNSGVFGYNASGNLVFAATTAGQGSVTLAGPLIAGGEINGALITGTGIQTHPGPDAGVKINSSGLLAYSTHPSNYGQLTLAFLTSTGSLAMKGALTSGSTVTGAEVVGGMVRTSQYYANSIHLGMTDAAVMGLKVFGPLPGPLLLYIRPDVSTVTPVIQVRGGLEIQQNPSGLAGLASQFRVRSGVETWFDSGGLLTVNCSATFNSGIQATNITAGGDKNFNGGNVYLNPNDTVTPGGGDNSYVHMRASDGWTRLRPATSSRRFKRDIEEIEFDVPRAIEALRPVQFRWNPAGFDADPEIPEGHTIEEPDELNIGAIAEEVHDAGLERWVNYDADGATPRSINESRMWVAQQQMIRFLWDQVKDLQAQVEALQN